MNGIEADVGCRPFGEARLGEVVCVIEVDLVGWQVHVMIYAIANNV